ncbi:AbiV family abortive infection protein [Bradyrhizobium zhanjiangense]|uniref:AbiV family abortive infection protein n=1 Tax=Bradyrhizobium zhanjiangense TaxID=1325107 RepID=A0ABY0DG35_9BRAD|nr:AbiV family abortive infection protein [Bradyrhizobium zhanjiangense]RXG90630.1 AbiV family abortive infection protein [Bradyrhizobium zhanjiangense]
MMAKLNDDERRTLIAEIANGATLAFANAEQLFKEGEVLASIGALPRALFLHQISLEECGKIEILGAWATSVLAKIDVDQTRLARALANHKAKNGANAYMLELSPAEKTARSEKDWKESAAAFDEMKRLYHEDSNEAKNAALYVDFDGSKFHSPETRITTKMVKATAKRNAEFLGLMEPKLRILQGWANDFDSAPPLDGFLEFAEKLRADNPDGPYEAFDAIMNELRARMTRKGKGPVKG